MKKSSLLIILLTALSTLQLSAQCSCGSYQTVAPPSQMSGNCHQYVRAYFKDSGGHFGEWIPPYSFNFSVYPSTPIYNDADFVETCDPNDAQVVYYPCNHSAVFTSNTCLISKGGATSEYGRHGIGGSGCSTSNLRFFKYKYRSSSYQASTSCSFTTDATACPPPCTPPAKPTDIYLSSPSGCKWIVSTTSVPTATSYTWSGYGTFSTPAGPSLNPGWYSLAVRANNSCGSSAWYTESINVPTAPGCSGVSGNQTSSQSFVLSPNPADRELVLSASGDVDDQENMEVSVLNMLGQVMTSVTSTEGTDFRFDVSAYQKGIYIVVVRQNGRVKHFEKVIVQH